ncbi:unnamed protein product [Urochloa humidicola]
MSRKRKIGEALVAHMDDLAAPPVAVLQHIVPAAVADIVSRVISAVIGKFQQEQPDVDAEVERLERLVMMLRAAVEAAVGVHIQNWWLRRWLWTIRDAALDGTEVARSFRRRAAEEASRRRREERSWRPLLRRSSGGRWDTLKREVARLEDMASGMGYFLMLLHMEAGLAPPPVLPQLDNVLPRLDVPLETRRPAVVRAVVGNCCARNMSAAVDKRRDADSSTEGQLVERLAVLVIMVHGAVDEAERVHNIRSGFLLEWMSRLRDAALQGDDVLRLFR